MICLDTKRPAFSMVTAVFVILLLATLGGFIMNLSGKVVQETTDQYRKEQAILYAKSYTEYAIMAATAEDCIYRIQADIGGNAADVRQGRGYRADVRIQYIGNNSTCANNRSARVGNVSASAIDNMIIIDTYIRYRNPESIAAMRNVGWGTDQGITYYRRTLQKL